VGAADAKTNVDAVVDILRRELRLVSVGGEPCELCGDIVDCTFKVKDGCLERSAELILKMLAG
jgi:hypothetical protein